jgi:F-type H+-transporting ATPase subunit gamma
VLTGNRGLCGGYNSNVQRAGVARWKELQESVPQTTLEVSGKRGISAFKFREIIPHESFTHFEDKPTYEEVDLLANRYLDHFALGKLDRLDVAYTRFEGIARQVATVETLLPLGALAGANERDVSSTESQYEFLPSAQSILEEVVPTSFKVKLFKCFLDAAVSEQIARMVAMKAATENADKIIKKLSMTYNRARQSQITGEIMEVLGGVEALKG